jgi:hypothetical protein
MVLLVVQLDPRHRQRILHHATTRGYSAARIAATRARINILSEVVNGGNLAPAGPETAVLG